MRWDRLAGLPFAIMAEPRSLAKMPGYMIRRLDQTFNLQLSVRSDGAATSSVTYLGEDGLALGTYTLYDEFDNTVGFRAFYFTVVDGMHDLGPLVAGGLSAQGWEALALALRANDRGQIVGQGRMVSQQLDGQMAFLLTPVPEPSSLLLATFGVIGLLTRRRGIG